MGRTGQRYTGAKIGANAPGAVGRTWGICRPKNTPWCARAPGCLGMSWHSGARWCTQREAAGCTHPVAQLRPLPCSRVASCRPRSRRSSPAPHPGVTPGRKSRRTRGARQRSREGRRYEVSSAGHSRIRQSANLTTVLLNHSREKRASPTNLVHMPLRHSPIDLPLGADILEVLYLRQATRFRTGCKPKEITIRRAMKRG